VTGTAKSYTYRELRDEVARFAGVLRDQGVAKGDRVVIYMPMVPEAVVAMLATARLGAVHSVVFGGFAPNELATRIEDAGPKVIVSASCGIEPNRVIPYKPLLDEAIRLSPTSPERCVILARPQVEASLVEGRDVDWFDRHGRGHARRLRAGGGHRPALRALHLRNDRESQRASCGTTAVTPSR
jgi:propionyl-CoA synthetase